MPLLHQAAGVQHRGSMIETQSSTTQSDIQARLVAQVADAWYAGLAKASFSLSGVPEAQERIAELAGKAVAWLWGESADDGEPQAIGRALAALHWLEPAVLGTSQQVLSMTLQGVAGDGVPARWHGKVAHLLGGLAEGFYDQARSAILDEQEGIHRALFKARYQLERELRESEATFRSLAETAPVAIAIYQHSQPVYINSSYASLLGFELEELQDVDYARFLHPASRPVVSEMVQRIQQEEQLPVRFQAKLLTKSGEAREVEVTLVRVEYQGRWATLVTSFDVTDRVRDQEALERTGRRLTLLSEVDRASLTGSSPREIAELAIQHLRQVIPCDRATFMEVEVVEKGLLVRHAHSHGETAAVAYQGRRIHVPDSNPAAWARFRSVPDVSEVLDELPMHRELIAVGIHAYITFPIYFQDRLLGYLAAGSRQPYAFTREHERIIEEIGSRLSVALRNAVLFAELQKAQTRLRSLSLRMVELQEAEKRRIGRELHDDLGQLLTGLKMGLELAQDMPPAHANQQLAEMQGLVAELRKRVRKLSVELRPPMLDDLGLLHTLLWHFDRYTEQTHVRVVFRYDLPARRFADEVETAAFRIVQESLTNVARHAGVSQAIVRLWGGQDALHVQIEDQGRGFDLQTALAQGQGLGLSGMIERAELLGGDLAVETQPGRGTCVTAALPVLEEPSLP